MTSAGRIAFIVGCPRSGTTLVQQLLNAHPDVAIGPETHFVRRFWLRRERYGDLSSDMAWEKLLRDIAAMPELGDARTPPEQFLAAAADVPREYPALLRRLIELFAGDRDPRVAGEKTPNHLLYMPLLESWFPEAVFIHVVRDPRAVVNSWRTVPWTTGSVSGDAAVWRRYMATARRHPPRSDRLVEVRYELLVENLEPELRRLCRFLGLAYRPTMLDHGGPGGTGLDSRREPWKAGARRPLYRSALDRWERELSARQVRQIEGVAGKFLEPLGYRARTSLLPRVATGLYWRGAALVRRAFQRLRRRG